MNYEAIRELIVENHLQDALTATYKTLPKSQDKTKNTLAGLSANLRSINSFYQKNHIDVPEWQQQVSKIRDSLLEILSEQENPASNLKKVKRKNLLSLLIIMVLIFGLAMRLVWKHNSLIHETNITELSVSNNKNSPSNSSIVQTSSPESESEAQKDSYKDRWQNNLPAEPENSGNSPTFNANETNKQKDDEGVNILDSTFVPNPNGTEKENNSSFKESNFQKDANGFDPSGSTIAPKQKKNPKDNKVKISLNPFLFKVGGIQFTVAELKVRNTGGDPIRVEWFKVNLKKVNRFSLLAERNSLESQLNQLDTRGESQLKHHFPFSYEGLLTGEPFYLTDKVSSEDLKRYAVVFCEEMQYFAFHGKVSVSVFDVEGRVYTSDDIEIISINRETFGRQLTQNLKDIFVLNQTGYELDNSTLREVKKYLNNEALNPLTKKEINSLVSGYNEDPAAVRN